MTANPRRTGRAVALAAAIVLLVLSASGAAAQTDGGQQQQIDELGLTVEAGFDGHTREAGWQPVTVGFEPLRPVAGTLTITSRGNGSSQALSVEVAAGSRKLYRVLAPPGPFDVTFDDENADALTVRPVGAGDKGEYLVGLIGGDGANLPPIRSDITGELGTWVGLDVAWLEMSPRALQPLGAVVGRVADLQALSPKAVRNLAAAVTDGVDLVVAGGGAEDLRALGLPWEVPGDAWQAGATAGGLRPAGADVTVLPAGYGRLALTQFEPGSPGAGRSAPVWSALAQPSLHAGGMGGDYRITSTSHQFSRLLSEQGSEVPTLPGLGFFVVAYVLVVGPVNGVVLSRMNRRELAWATVPLVTLIFTAGAFVGATAGRPAAGGAARLTYWSDGIGTEFVAAGVRTPTPGDRSLTFPGTDWTVTPLVDGRRGSTVTRDTDTRVTMNVTALQLGGVAAWRTIDQPPPLRVRAVAGADGVSVRIRNTSGRPLRNVEVRAATTNRSILELAPGAATTVELGGQSMPTVDAYQDPFGSVPIDNDGVVTPPVSLRAVLHAEIADGRPGMVWVSAEDPGAAPTGITADEGAVRNRGSLVAVGEPIQSRPAISPYTVQREAFATGGAVRVGPAALEGGGDVYLRYRLPPGADPANITDALHRNRGGGPGPDITVWDPNRREWVDTITAFTDRDPRDLVSPLGEVWVRASGDMFPFEYSGRTIAGGTS